MYPSFAAATASFLNSKLPFLTSAAVLVVFAIPQICNMFAEKLLFWQCGRRMVVLLR